MRDQGFHKGVNNPKRLGTSEVNISFKCYICGQSIHIFLEFESSKIHLKSLTCILKRVKERELYIDRNICKYINKITAQ